MRSWRLRPVICAAVTWGALALSSSALASPGDLDGGYGAGGAFSSPVQSAWLTTWRGGVAIDADGRALTTFVRDDDANGTGTALMVARLTSTGALDPSFKPLGSTPGLTEIDLGPVVQPDELVDAKGIRPGPGGTVYVLATSTKGGSEGGSRVLLFRLTPEGELDSGFGSGGRVIESWQLFTSYPGAEALAVDSAGRALVAGTFTAATSELRVTRYTTGGVPDNGWGVSGRASIPYAGHTLIPYDVEALSGGGVVVGGLRDDRGLAARFTADGQPDAGFSDDGVATTNLIGLGSASDVSVAVDGQGRVLLAGAKASPGIPGMVARFTSGGDADGGFGSGTPAPGVVELPGAMRGTTDLIVGCEDRVLVAGNSQVSLNASKAALTRLNSSGAIDAAFAPGAPAPGIVIDDAMEIANGLATDSQGRAYLSGARQIFDPAADVRARVVRHLDATGCAPGEQPPGPPAPPSEPPATGGGGAGGGAGSAVAARFGGPLRAASYSRTTFDASGSTGATGYRWDVNGDGRDDVACGASEPLLTTRMSATTRAASTTVRLTALGSGGATSTTSQAVAVASSSTAQRLATSVGQPLACASKESRIVAKLSCTPETLDFGAVSAAGCFERVDDRAGVPKGELPILDAAIAYFNENQRRRQYVVKSCTEVFSGKCTVKAGEITRAEVDPLLTASDLRISRSAVKINGLEITPRSGATIAVFPQIGRVVSSNAVVKFGDTTVPLPDAPRVNLDVDGGGTINGNIFGSGGRITIASFKPNIPFTDFAGFSIDGEVKLDLVDGGVRKYSEASFRLALPNDFAVFGGKPPSGAVKVQADNPNGVVLDEIDVQVPEADLGGLKFSDVRFHYLRRGAEGCPGRFWKATANVFLGVEDDSAGIKLTPPPTQNGIAFCQGSFKSAGGEFVFGSPIPPPQIFPGVFLKAINFATQLDPTLIRGGGTVSAANITEVKGGILSVFASPAHPYTLSGSDATNGLENLKKLAGRKLESTTIAAGGTFGFSLPVIGRVDFGKGYFLYSYRDYIAFGGEVLIPAPGVVITAGVDGELGVSSGLYSLHGSAEACVAGGISSIGCVGGEAWLTSKGFVVCGDIAGEFHPGVGYHWGDTFPEIWLGIPGDGCKPSGYWLDTAIKPARGAQAGGARTFRVAAGVKAVRVRIIGSGGAPDVTVKGPDGETVSTASAEYVKGKRIAALRHLPGGVTWLGIRAQPGEYTITPNAGSTAIRSVATSEPAELPKITGSVTTSGARRTLSYRIAALGRGEQVTFYERGATTFRKLGTTTKLAGAIGFTPDGTGSARRITALIEVRGMRVGEATIARYSFKLPRPARPGPLVVRRRGKAISVSWPAVAGAARYGIVVSPALGPQRILKVRARAIRFTGTSATGSGVVQVTALDAAGRPGRPRTGRWRGKAGASRFLPFRELRAGTRR